MKFVMLVTGCVIEPSSILGRDSGFNDEPRLWGFPGPVLLPLVLAEVLDLVVLEGKLGY